MTLWKTPDQKPEERRQILFYAGCGGLLNKGWYYSKNDAFGNYSSKNVQKWAYVDELFAQADKAERLQKAADLAVDVLEVIKNNMPKNDETHSARWIENTITTIKQLIKENQ